MVNDRSGPPNGLRILGAAALIVVGVGLLVYITPAASQAFRGPRPVTPAELIAIREPGWWDNYIRITPTQPPVDTNLRYGKKGNEGTKYLLLLLNDHTLFCSARVNDNGPEFIGRLESMGGTDKQAAGLIGGAQNLLPFMLQSVRSIWFDVGAIGALGIGAIVTGIWMIARTAMGRE